MKIEREMNMLVKLDIYETRVVRTEIFIEADSVKQVDEIAWELDTYKFGNTQQVTELLNSDFKQVNPIGFRTAHEGTMVEIGEVHKVKERK